MFWREKEVHTKYQESESYQISQHQYWKLEYSEEML